MLDALKTYAPDVCSGTQAAMRGEVNRTIDLDYAAFATTPSITPLWNARRT